MKLSDLHDGDAFKKDPDVEAWERSDRDVVAHIQGMIGDEFRIEHTGGGRDDTGFDIFYLEHLKKYKKNNDFNVPYIHFDLKREPDLYAEITIGTHYMRHWSSDTRKHTIKIESPYRLNVKIKILAELLKTEITDAMPPTSWQLLWNKIKNIFK